MSIATNIQMAVLPALCAANQLPGERPTDVEDALTPAPGTKLGGELGEIVALGAEISP